MISESFFFFYFAHHFIPDIFPIRIVLNFNSIHIHSLYAKKLVPLHEPSLKVKKYAIAMQPAHPTVHFTCALSVLCK